MKAPVILLHTAEFSSTTAAGASVLHFAVEFNYPNITRYLLTLRALDLTVKRNGKTAAEAAAILGFDVIADLISEEEKRRAVGQLPPLHYLQAPVELTRHTAFSDDAHVGECL